MPHNRGSWATWALVACFVLFLFFGSNWFTIKG